eukprot:952557-Lingulodinium_polyedra.AAC.1
MLMRVRAAVARGVRIRCFRRAFHACTRCGMRGSARRVAECVCGAFAAAYLLRSALLRCQRARARVLS